MSAGSIAFSEWSSSEIVGERLSRAGQDDLVRGLIAVVTHLHQVVREVRPTAAQWRAAVDFLTEVGHAADERRQEWVLLSDLLGVTALVEEINSQRPKGATPNTLRGPFYRADAPRLPLGADICLDGKGEPLTVSGLVRDLDGRPIGGATIETWQANPQGYYENQQPDLQPEFNLRGVFQTGPDGRFAWRTVKPAGYKVPDDGPVGQLLGRIGYPLRRPAHLHFLVRAAGFETVTTQVYDPADPDIHEDAIFAVKPELVGEFQGHRDRGGCHFWSLAFDFVLVRARSGSRRTGNDTRLMPQA